MPQATAGMAGCAAGHRQTLAAWLTEQQSREPCRNVCFKACLRLDERQQDVIATIAVLQAAARTGAAEHIIEWHAQTLMHITTEGPGAAMTPNLAGWRMVVSTEVVPGTDWVAAEMLPMPVSPALCEVMASAVGCQLVSPA